MRIENKVFSSQITSTSQKNAEPAQSFEEMLKAQESKQQSVKKSQKEQIEKFKMTCLAMDQLAWLIN